MVASVPGGARAGGGVPGCWGPCWAAMLTVARRHSIEYWFRCMDLDGDGVLSMYELEYFYEEQCRRLDSMAIEALPFEDCLCQMLDLVKPQSEGDAGGRGAPVRQGHPRGRGSPTPWPGACAPSRPTWGAQAQDARCGHFRGPPPPSAPPRPALCWGPRGVFGGCGSREPTRCVRPGAPRTPSRVRGWLCPDPPASVGVVRPCPAPWSQVSAPGATVSWAFLPWLRASCPVSAGPGQLRSRPQVTRARPSLRRALSPALPLPRASAHTRGLARGGGRWVLRRVVTHARRGRDSWAHVGAA